MIFFIEFEKLDDCEENEIFDEEFGEEGHNIYRVDTKSKKLFFQEAYPFLEGIGIFYLEDI